MKKIPLTQGKFALVDDDMFDFLNQWKWYTYEHRNTYYAKRHVNATKHRGKAHAVMMHRVVFVTAKGSYVDHINHDGLDNQRHNLRKCTNSQNTINQITSGRNTSGFRGVSWAKGRKKWRSGITVNGKTIGLGYFFCIIKAAKAYDTASRKYHDKYGKTNF